MRWLKVIFVSLFIGFYFLSITPIHFYAHSFETDHSSDTQTIDDCSYVSLLQSGQGSFLDTEIFSFSDDIPIAIFLEVIVTSTSSRLEDDFFFNFTLRGPPTLV